MLVAAFAVVNPELAREQSPQQLDSLGPVHNGCAADACGLQMNRIMFHPHQDPGSDTACWHPNQSEAFTTQTKSPDLSYKACPRVIGPAI